MNKLADMKIRKFRFLIFPRSISHSSWSVVACLVEMPTQLKTSFSFPSFTLRVQKAHLPPPPVICWTPVHNAAGWWITPGVPNSNEARRRSATCPLVPLRSDNSSQGGRPYTTTKNSQNQNLITAVRSSMDLRTKRPNGPFSNRSWNNDSNHSFCSW
jgi:hypothetical protein